VPLEGMLRREPEVTLADQSAFAINSLAEITKSLAGTIKIAESFVSTSRAS
jgi:hypothetical protein